MVDGIRLREELSRQSFLLFKTLYAFNGLRIWLWMRLEANTLVHRVQYAPKIEEQEEHGDARNYATMHIPTLPQPEHLPPVSDVSP